MAKGAGGRGGRLETEEDADGESVCVCVGGVLRKQNSPKGSGKTARSAAASWPRASHGETRLFINKRQSPHKGREDGESRYLRLKVPLSALSLCSPRPGLAGRQGQTQPEDVSGASPHTSPFCPRLQVRVGEQHGGPGLICTRGLPAAQACGQCARSPGSLALGPDAGQHFSARHGLPKGLACASRNRRDQRTHFHSAPLGEPTVSLRLTRGSPHPREATPHTFLRQRLSCFGCLRLWCPGPRRHTPRAPSCSSRCHLGGRFRPAGSGMET